MPPLETINGRLKRTCDRQWHRLRFLVTTFMSSILRRVLDLFSRLRSGAIDVSSATNERHVEEINRREHGLLTQSDEELQRQVAVIRQHVRDGMSLDKILIDSFALIREVARRTVSMRPYDVQLLAALEMHDCKLVEMQTGEGKTLVAVFPAAIRAFLGHGVHVLTFNDYLAARDADWMGPIYRFLGLTVGHVAQGMSAAERRSAYACDVTYVTAKEAGFDFLRDQCCLDPSRLVQRGFHFAIVDEADSILIDEARVPLVIAGPADEGPEDLYRLAEVICTLRAGIDFSTDQGCRNVNFNAPGLNKLQRELRCGELYTEENVHLLTRLNLALQAEVLLRRDVDYLVRDSAIALIDEMTGRVAENRRWPYGLQAALEAKERLPIQPQGKILNSITLQHFLELYERLAGMTGTAQDAAEELYAFYHLRVTVIPPNRPCLRTDHLDRVFATKAAKHVELIREIIAAHETGRPVLVGTASVKESEDLASQLREAGIACTVLNAKNDQQEAELVADAGAIGAVTISTNMAGRGTDIRLGGNDERDRERVILLGGLLVLGTNRHESRRIDNQLRGRAGRQGDPGDSRFFVSVEDDLIHRYKIGELIASSTAVSAGETLDDPTVGRTIAHVQRIIEGESFEIRSTLRRYSFLLERQRRVMQTRREKLMTGAERPTLLCTTDADLFQMLAAKFGEAIVVGAELEVTLCQMDRCWSDYLAHVAEIREGIHLLSMGGENAFDAFNRQINQAFREVIHRVDEEVINTLRTAHISATGIDLQKEGLLGPSSTWTYMINDNPMGDILDRLARGIKRMITKSG
jgi:preprotein translocase subunit SecA